MSNLNSEKLLLSGFYNKPQIFFDYIQYLDETDFNSDASRYTFNVIKSLLLDKRSDTLTKSRIVAEAKSLGYMNFIAVTKNGEWLDSLISEKIKPEEISQHFLEIKKRSLISAYKKALEEVGNYLDSTPDSLSQIIGKVEDSIISKVQLIDKGERAIVSLTNDIVANLDKLAENPGNIGLDLGYPIWQSKIGQIRNGSITFIVGTSKSGKSQLGLKAAAIAAHKLQIPALILDSELNKFDQQIRLMAILSKVPSDIIETGVWKMNEGQLFNSGITDAAEIAKILEYQKRLNDPHLRDVVSKLPIDYQSIYGMSVSDVLPHVKRWLLTKVKPSTDTRLPQCLIIYDYIKLATSALGDMKQNKLAEWQMHGLNVSDLHNFVNKYNVPCIAFGQTNNEIDNGFKCVAGGKRIIENVTSITYIKRKTVDEKSMDGNGSHMFKVFGARYGKGLGEEGYINYDIDLSCGDFKELNVGAINFDQERQRRIKEWKDKKDDHDDE